MRRNQVLKDTPGLTQPTSPEAQPPSGISSSMSPEVSSIQPKPVRAGLSFTRYQKHPKPGRNEVGKAGDKRLRSGAAPGFHRKWEQSKSQNQVNMKLSPSHCFPTQNGLHLPLHLPKSSYTVKATHHSSPSLSELLVQNLTGAPHNCSALSCTSQDVPWLVSRPQACA